ncbi:TetR/AcrR family transcriptional regulator [Nocardioides sambongensis]|uniref:TetR/AcrR family transcriptional regulator n=1 Tax=Nocardioides sambongensis TaxID=2589074 RepID=UPI00112D5D58|nr:TetR/AcrR family transcriptional regulator [Nocardioides sambongensis]
MARDRRILDAAAVAFHEKGFHGVGMDELGSRAGLSGPSLYRYFSGKDEILAKLLDEAMDELLTATEPTDPDPRGDLERALRHHVDFALVNRPLVALYQREVRSLADPWAAPFAVRRKEYTKAWERLVSRARPALDEATIGAVTQGCLGLVFSVPGWPERTLAVPRAADAIVDLVLHGLVGVDSAP